MALTGSLTSALDRLRGQAVCYTLQDAERAEYVESLLCIIADLEKEKAVLQSDKQQAQDLNSFYVRKKKEDEVELDTQTETIAKLQAEREEAPFVLVLIDADITLFREDLIVAGIEGGESAARRLRGSLKQELKSLNKFVDHWKILIRVYANITGLGRNYVESGIISVA